MPRVTSTLEGGEQLRQHPGLDARLRLLLSDLLLAKQEERKLRRWFYDGATGPMTMHVDGVVVRYLLDADLGNATILSVETANPPARPDV
jgi:hypothetical protein